MARVKVADVREVLPAFTTLQDPQIKSAIDAATCSVDQIAAGCASDLNDQCLKQVEKYLSAHYAAATENTLTLSSESDGCSDSSATYGFKFGEGIKGTPFGQMANTLSHGCLAQLDKQPVFIASIGTIGC